MSEEQRNHLEALRKVAAPEITSTLQSLLESLLPQIAGLLESEGAGVFLYNRDIHALELVFPAFGRTAENFTTALIPVADQSSQRIHGHTRITARVFLSGVPYFTNAISDDAGGTPSLSRHYRVKSLLAVPLEACVGRIGVLVIANHCHSQFSLADADLLSLVLRPIADLISHLHYHEHICNKNAVLESLSLLHTRLLRAALLRSPLAHIAAIVAEQAHCPVVIEDSDLYLLAYHDTDVEAPNTYEECIKFPAKHLASEDFQRFLSRLVETGAAQVAPMPLNSDLVRLMASAIEGTTTHGYVSFVGDDGTFTQESELMLLSLAGAVATRMSLDKQTSALQTPSADQLLEQIVLGLVDDATILQRAQGVGLRLPTVCRLLVIDVPGAQESILTQIRTMLGEVLGRHQTGIRVFVLGGFVAVLVPEAADGCSSWRTVSEESVGALDDLGVGAASVVACSRTASLGHWPKAYSQATKTIRIVRGLGHSSGVFAYDDIAVTELLLAGDAGEHWRHWSADVLAPLLDYETKKKGGLLWTLLLVLEGTLCQREIARQLFVHRNTVTYRIKRIEELCGVDLQVAK